MLSTPLPLRTALLLGRQNWIPGGKKKALQEKKEAFFWFSFPAFCIELFLNGLRFVGIPALVGALGVF